MRWDIGVRGIKLQVIRRKGDEARQYDNAGSQKNNAFEFVYSPLFHVFIKRDGLRIVILRGLFFAQVDPA